jgi:hypothetical protein
MDDFVSVPYICRLSHPVVLHILSIHGPRPALSPRFFLEVENTSIRDILDLLDACFV